MIKLDAFLVVLHFLGTDIDVDELACILANLIAQVGDGNDFPFKN